MWFCYSCIKLKGKLIIFINLSSLQAIFSNVIRGPSVVACNPLYFIAIIIPNGHMPRVREGLLLKVAYLQKTAS